MIFEFRVWCPNNKSKRDGFMIHNPRISSKIRMDKKTGESKKSVSELIATDQKLGFTWMLYIGIKDSRKKKIFDGDILKDNEGDLWIVKFNEGTFWFVKTHDKDNAHSLEWFKGKNVSRKDYWGKGWMIVGNIFENGNYLIYKTRIVKKVLPTREEKSEKEFMNLLMKRNWSKLNTKTDGEIHKMIKESVAWWKHKNKSSKPIAKDDLIALSMIEKRILSKKYEIFKKY